MALALVLASLPARPQAGSASGRPGPPQQGEVEVTADHMVYDWEERRLTLDGHVVAIRGPAILRAAHGVLDRRAGTLRLDGGVLAVQGREVLVAEAAQLDLDASSAELQGAALFLKDRSAPPLQALTDRNAVRGTGRNALILTGKRVRRLPSGALVAEGVTLTPCDCAGEPDYELASPEVEVKEDRARLADPTLRLLGGSLPLLVPLSLPLTERQSGLLFPPLAYAAITGFGTEVPLFLTLGRSYDVTVAPGIFTGSGGAGSAALGSRSVSGPRLGLQFRYAPIERTEGQIDADLVQDLKQHDSPGGDAPYPGEAPASRGRGFGGLRGVLRFSHRTDSGGFTAAAQSTIATDNMVVPDTEPRELDRFLDALRTDVGVVGRSAIAGAGVDATLLQDVRISDGGRPDRRLFGAERLATFQRLPSAFAQIAPARLGPFALAAEASVARFAPFGPPDVRERETGFGPTDLVRCDLDPTPCAQPAAGGPQLGRARAVRFDASPRISWGGSGLPVLLSVELGARADAWLFDGDSSRNRQRLYGLAGAHASLSLARSFGNLLHVVVPEVELRAVTPAVSSGSAQRIGDPFDAGGHPFTSDPEAAEQGVTAGFPRRGDPASHVAGVPASRRAYDELDGAAPEDGEALATLRIAQAIWGRPALGRAPVRIARLELAQDVVLRAGSAHARLGEAGAVAALQLGPFGGDVRAQFDWDLGALTLLSGGASARSARGDELHANMLLLRGAASERIRAGADELFAAARIAADPGDLYGGVGFGGSVGLPLRRQGLRLAYDASHLLGALPQDAADWSHRLALLYETPCRCAGLQLSAAFPFRGGKLLKGPSIGVLVDLKSLGSFATF